MSQRSERLIQMPLRMPPDLKKQLKLLAIKQETSVQAILRQLVRDYVNAHSEKTAA